MSTRGSTWTEDPTDMEWTPTPKPWCAFCCAPRCGCPNEPTVPANVTLGQE